MRRLVALALLLAAPSAAQQVAAPFTVVESGRGFATFQQAVSAIGGGQGTIRIAPGRYTECAVQEAGSVRYVAAEPGKVVFDRAICEGKATLVLRGRSAAVDGIVFEHTFVSDGNGAGIRIEHGDLTVANAMFLDGQCGILSAPDKQGTIKVDRSTFSGLGKDPTGNGAHSLYIGDYAALTVTRSRFERGTGGHYVKSRAAKIEVLDSSFDDSQGHATNYMIDLSNGASGRIAGNVFVVGKDKENHGTLITVAPEGAQQSSAGLVVEGNKATLAPGADWHPAFVGNWSGEAVTVRGNTLADAITPLEHR